MTRLSPAMVLLFLSLNLFSQERPFRLYTSGLAPLDMFSRHMVTVGGEAIAFKHFGIAVEYGYKFSDILQYDTAVVRSKGYSLRGELKFYDAPILKTGKLRNYFALEYRYISDNHNMVFNYYSDESWSEFFEDNMGVLEDIYIGNIKWGFIIPVGSRLYFDLYCGLGVRYRDIKNVNREYNPDSGHESGYREPFIGIQSLSESSGFSPNASFGFKFGIKL